MNSFPIIKNDELLRCFERIVTLFVSDKRKILEATERSTLGQLNPYIISNNTDEYQLDVIRRLIRRTADRSGQNLLIRIIEEIYVFLYSNGVVGVSIDSFVDCTFFDLAIDNKIQYNTEWTWKWKINVQDYDLEINIGLRNKSHISTEIVPDHVLQYIQQSIIAFNNNRNAASLALMSIALEGTLRDALDNKGYTYNYGAPTQDVYGLCEMNIFPDANGFKVQFPNAMPQAHSLYLSNAGDPSHETFRVKRIIKGQDSFLEIRNVNSLLDFWSLNNVVTPAQMNISGLGAAIRIARNHANFLTDLDLPSDTDNVIQTVRNNLIHLSTNALLEQVTTSSGTISLGEYLKDKNKVSDAIISISEAINSIYNRLSNNTL
ncbi:hypothetical protein [Flavobacterium frigoris]|uniref:Uncharacterized protein n=1 Tax=Flavobacterium frigoris TaxID=229204 RepID=A0A1H9RVP2_FLAFI|nr:hypothetical protein [Flavobacterium frigoris]SER76658.1 hypothetical protein SAMN05444355_12515 [Flavobacterium frigoris]